MKRTIAQSLIEYEINLRKERCDLCNFVLTRNEKKAGLGVCNKCRTKELKLIFDSILEEQKSE
jgi:hypothetical protein